MKLEELTKLGIAEDIAKQVVSMNEAEVSAETKKLTDKEAELTMATDKIRELTETVKKFDGVDVEKMKTELADWSKKYDEDTAALKLDNALTLALADSGAIDKDIVKGLIDRSIVKLDGGKLIGVSEQLEKLKSEKAFLFGEKAAEEKPSGMTAQLGTQLGAQHDKPAGGGAETLGAAIAEHYHKADTKPSYTAEEVGADATGSASTALTAANSYTDIAIANLVGTAPEDLNTLEELAQAYKDNKDFAEILSAAITKKQNKLFLGDITTNDVDWNTLTTTGFYDIKIEGLLSDNSTHGLANEYGYGILIIIAPQIDIVYQIYINDNRRVFTPLSLSSTAGISSWVSLNQARGEFLSEENMLKKFRSNAVKCV